LLVTKRNQYEYRIFTKRMKQLSASSTLIMALTILYFAFSPQALQASIGVNDKTLHFVAFAVLILPCAIFHVRSLVWILPMTLIFGGSIEILQPGFERDASWSDFRADGLGLIVGIVFGLLIRSILKKYENL
jgi:hypothetical protein